MSKNPTPHGTEVQDAAGDLAAFLKEAKASGTGSTEESPMPRRKPEIRAFLMGVGEWCVCVLFFSQRIKGPSKHIWMQMCYSCWVGGIFTLYIFILYIYIYICDRRHKKSRIDS